MTDPAVPPPSYSHAVEGASPMDYKPPVGQDPAYPADVPPYGQPSPAYPQNPAYPPQQGYPPNQEQPVGGYPPQQAGGYQGPPPQPGYQGGYAPQNTVVISQQPTAGVTTVIHQSFRDFPVQTACPNCHNNVTTQVRTEPGAFAWILCLVIAFFGGWLGCCLIPFCVPGCQDATHTCPVCKYQVAHFSHM